jgi:hypothetical protein
MSLRAPYDRLAGTVSLRAQGGAPLALDRPGRAHLENNRVHGRPTRNDLVPYLLLLPGCTRDGTDPAATTQAERRRARDVTTAGGAPCGALFRVVETVAGLPAASAVLGSVRARGCL